MQLNPTTPLCWTWEKKEYYWKVLLDLLIENVDPNDGSKLSQLQEKVKIPPPMSGTKHISFLRKYPDVFHVETDTSESGDAIVKVNKNYDLPSWV